jgi:hypothetical protein
MEAKSIEKKASEAMVKDSHRKRLFQKLFDLYAKSEPILLVKNGMIIIRYSEQTESLADAIRDEIQVRDKEIFESFKN